MGNGYIANWRISKHASWLFLDICCVKSKLNKQSWLCRQFLTLLGALIHVVHHGRASSEQDYSSMSIVWQITESLQWTHAGVLPDDAVFILMLFNNVSTVEFAPRIARKLIEIGDQDWLQQIKRQAKQLAKLLRYVTADSAITIGPGGWLLLQQFQQNLLKSLKVARPHGFQQFVELTLDDDIMAEQADLVLKADMPESMLFFVHSIHLGLQLKWWTQIRLWDDSCTTCTLSLYIIVKPACSCTPRNSWMGNWLSYECHRRLRSHFM